MRISDWSSDVCSSDLDGGSDWVGRRVTKRGRPSSRQDVGRGPKAEHAEADQEMGPLDGARTAGASVHSTHHRPGKGGSLGDTRPASRRRLWYYPRTHRSANGGKIGRGDDAGS